MVWRTRHGDYRNSDFLAIPGSIQFEQSWQALQNIPAATFAAFDQDGNSYLLTLNQPDEHCGTLWSFTKEGHLRWSSSEMKPSLTSLAVHDNHCVYVSDGYFLHCFTNLGALQWKVAVEKETAAIVFLPNGELFVLEIDGTINVYDPENGNSLIQPISLPCAPMQKGVNNPNVPKSSKAKFLAKSFQNIGVASQYTSTAIQRFIGIDVSAKNVPAIDTRNDQVYIAATNKEGDGGVFYGLSILRNEQNCITDCHMAFQTPMGPGCDTSPAISEDSEHIYCMDQEGLFYAFNSIDGSIAWTIQINGVSSASPTVTDTNKIMISTVDSVVCIEDNGRAGNILWITETSEIAKKYGYPIGKINSVLCASQRYVYGVITVGPMFLKRVLIPKQNFLLTIDQSNGEVLNENPINQECYCTLSIASDSSIYIPSKPFLRAIMMRFQWFRFIYPSIKLSANFFGLTVLKGVD